jgi:hypothetical protein
MTKDDLKYKNWVFTWNAENDGTIISTENLRVIFSDYAETYCFQAEEVSRLHYQGMFTLNVRKRFKTVLNDIQRKLDSLSLTIDTKSLTIDRMHGTIEEAIEYCTKTDSRVEGPYYSYNIQPYIPHDLAVFIHTDNLYKWQRDVMQMIFGEHQIGFAKSCLIQPADDRTIVVIVDKKGNSGKSKLVKNLCYMFPKQVAKLAFGSSQQLRSAIISAGPRKAYFLDIPKTLGDSDNIPDIISAIEDLKNGFIVSSMYGKYANLMMAPPHIILFTNFEIDTDMMSIDRWKVYAVTSVKTLLRMKVNPPKLTMNEQLALINKNKK